MPGDPSYLSRKGHWKTVASPKDETDREWLALLATVGESLHQLRRNQGWSLRELCRLQGYAPDSAMVSSLEKGTIPGVTLYRIWRTANTMGYKTRIVFEKKERR